MHFFLLSYLDPLCVGVCVNVCYFCYSCCCYCCCVHYTKVERKKEKKIVYLSFSFLFVLVYSWALHITIYRHIYQGCCTSVFLYWYCCSRVYTQHHYNGSGGVTRVKKRRTLKTKTRSNHDVAKMVSLQQVCWTNYAQAHPYIVCMCIHPLSHTHTHTAQNILF